MYICKQIAGKNKFSYSMMHSCGSNKFRFTNYQETKTFGKKILIDKICKNNCNKIIDIWMAKSHNLQWDWNLQHNQKHVVDCYGDSKVEITEQLIMIKKTKKAGSNHRLKSQVSCSCTAC